MMRFSEDHVWAERDGSDMVSVGLTAFAVSELGEISFVELPDIGTRVEAGEPASSIDSLKSTSDIYAPVSGTIASVNTLLSQEANLSLINEDPMGAGWVFTIRMDAPDQFEGLMDEAAYRKLIQG